MKLQKDGRGYSTITSVRGVVKPAFQMACDEDILRKNPFAFSLAGVVVNDTKKREALTPEEQEIFMTFVKEDSHYRCYYDEFNVLLGTGMRVSEFCGLTLSDLDFENRKIRVEKQLIKEKGGIYHVEKTKTESGVRFIPMSDEVFRSLKNIVANRKKPKKELLVGGYAGFLLLDKNGNPKYCYFRKEFYKLGCSTKRNPVKFYEVKLKKYSIKSIKSKILANITIKSNKFW
jgi:integrase